METAILILVSLSFAFQVFTFVFAISFRAKAMRDSKKMVDEAFGKLEQEIDRGLQEFSET